MADKSVLSPNPLGKIPPIAQARFWKFVQTHDSAHRCWDWLGVRGSEEGYGQFQFENRVFVATHVALALDGRGVPVGLFACHACDNPSCVNPSHLFVGSQTDNMQDRKRKGGYKSFREGTRTHCKRGHELKSESVYLSREGHISCRLCRKAATDKSNAKIALVRKQKRDAQQSPKQRQLSP